MAKKRKQWVWSPSSRASHPAVGATAKVEIETKAPELIDKVLKPLHVKPPPEDARFNYVSDITLKWHGSSLYFVAIYTCPDSPGLFDVSMWGNWGPCFSP